MKLRAQAIAVQINAIHIKKARHFKLMQLCQMLAKHVDWLNNDEGRI
jgi:hypothetical protein